MIVPSPMVLAYPSDQVFFCSTVESHNAKAVARMEFVAVTVVFFLRCARYGAAWNVTESDPCLKNNTGMLHPIPEDTRNILDHFGFMDLVFRTEFEPVLFFAVIASVLRVRLVGSYLKHPFMPHRWGESGVDHLEGSD